MSGLLNGSESLQFAKALFKAYLIPVELDQLLLSIDRLAVDQQVAMNATPDQAALQVVLKANREGWIPSLLKVAAADRLNRPEIQRFFADYSRLDPINNPEVLNPWTAYRLFGGQLFIGRLKVRRFLLKMTDPLSRKVLVIKSDRRQVGKTYTGALVGFVSQPPLNKVSPIDLDETIYDLRTLAERIAKEWDVNLKELPGQSEEQETRWAQQLANCLVKNAPSKDGLVRWLILDGFRERLPSAGIKALIDALAVKIQSNPSFRLILVNYTDPLPLAALAFEDIVVPLTLEEIKLALTEIHLSCCGYPANPEEIRDYMEEYATQLDAYKQRSPEHAESQLLVHNAVADVVEVM